MWKDNILNGIGLNNFTYLLYIMYKNICIFFIIGFFLFVLYNLIYEQCIKYKEGHQNPEDIQALVEELSELKESPAFKDLLAGG